MYGGGHQIRDWLWVEDHCRAIWMLEEQGILNDRFNIGGDCELPNRTVAEEILTYMGKSFELIGVSDERPGQDLRYGMSFDKLKRRTGWEPLMSFDDGLRKTIDWYLAR